MNMQIVTSLLALWVTCSRAATDQTIVYSWVKVDYDWPNDTMKEDYITNKKFIVENNVISGIKVYKDKVFITVPRWRSGVPSALNRVVEKIPTSALRDRDAQFSQHVRNMGARLSRSDGLTYGQRSLFYGLLDKLGIQRWLVADDAKTYGYDKVMLTSQEALVSVDVRMTWVDTFAWDESGHLWFTANDLGNYFAKTMDFAGTTPNMYVWKVFVNESSYLNNADENTASRASSINLYNAVLGAATLVAVKLILFSN